MLVLQAPVVPQSPSSLSQVWNNTGLNAVGLSTPATPRTPDDYRTCSFEMSSACPLSIHTAGDSTLAYICCVACVVLDAVPPVERKRSSTETDAQRATNSSGGGSAVRDFEVQSIMSDITQHSRAATLTETTGLMNVNVNAKASGSSAAAGSFEHEVYQLRLRFPVQLWNEALAFFCKPR